MHSRAALLGAQTIEQGTPADARGDAVGAPESAPQSALDVGQAFARTEVVNRYVVVLVQDGGARFVGSAEYLEDVEDWLMPELRGNVARRIRRGLRGARRAMTLDDLAIELQVWRAPMLRKGDHVTDRDIIRRDVARWEMSNVVWSREPVS